MSSSSSSPSLTPIPKPSDIFLSPPSSWNASTEPLSVFSSARLEHYKEEGTEKKILRSYDIGKKIVTVIGRLKESGIYYDHQSISRQHAAFIQHNIDGQPLLIIVDLGSHGGTFVNGYRLISSVPYRLSDGDILRFGSPLRYFQLKDSPAATRSTINIEDSALSSIPPPSSSSVSSSSSSSSSASKRSADDLSNPPDSKRHHSSKEVRVKHILVKHAASRKPESWRSSFITRSEEEAEQEILKYKAMIEQDPSKFDELAKKYSDCSSHERCGDLGYFKFEKMQPPFSKAAFALQIGQLSAPVHSDSGVHLILRTA